MKKANKYVIINKKNRKEKVSANFCIFLMKQAANIYKSTISPYIENKRFKDLNPTNFGWATMYGASEGTLASIRKEYIIHYVTDGKGEITIDGKKYIAKKGQCFFFKANQIASFKPATHQNWSWVWIIFTGELAKQFDNLKENIFDYEGDTFIKIMTESEQIKMREEYLASKLFEIYRIVFGKYYNFDVATAAENYLLQTNEINVSVQTIADELHISRNYLSKVFKKKYNITLQEYIFKRKMSNAMDLIRQGYKIKHVSVMLGYADVYTFTKAFKKFYKLSPGMVNPYKYPDIDI